MAKKIRFPLELRDGIEVRDMEGLRENFSLEQILFYLANGKLETWLRDRYMDDIADAILELDREDTEFNKKLCEIFEVEYTEDNETDLEKMMERKRKLELLEGFTDDKGIFDVVDQVAFDQDDLYDLLDEGESIIYLCGERFSIPLGKKEITYIGVNKPTVIISSKEKVDFEEKGISFENIQFDEKYQTILDGMEPVKESQMAGNNTSESRYGEYYSGSYLNFLLSMADKAGAKSCYEKICGSLEGLKYDVDADIREIREKLLNSGLIGMGNEFLGSL